MSVLMPTKLCTNTHLNASACAVTYVHTLTHTHTYTHTHNFTHTHKITLTQELMQAVTRAFQLRSVIECILQNATKLLLNWLSRQLFIKFQL